MAMSRHSFVLALLALVADSTRLATDLAALSSDSEWRERPIAKVVSLLQDMQAQLDAEGKEDEDMYDQMACWCETNDKAKTKSIADAKKKLDSLSSAIQENTAAAKTLETDIKALETSVEELTKALEEAEMIRAKELAEFNAEEKDMINSIGSLKGAVNSLSKANSGSAFEQQEALIQVQQVLRRRPSAAIAAVAPHERAEFNAFLTGPAEGISLIQEGVGLRTRQPASGAIFGILSQMKESFETNVAVSQKEEAQSAKEFVSLKTAKTAEVEASNSKLFTKKGELAKAKEATARAEEDLDDTENTLAADEEFLSNLKPKCASIDAEFEARKKNRLDEVTAIGQTIGILTSDEANDAMTKSMSLLQARALSKRQAAAREAAAAALNRAAQRLHSPRLAYLAVRTKIDAFAKVAENIDLMVNQLGKEQKDEVVKKDDCVTDLDTNDNQSKDRHSHKTDVEVEMADLESNIATVTDEEKAAEQAITDAQIELKKASDAREAENKDFQVTIADQRATQSILEKAMTRMQDFYEGSEDTTSFLQIRSRRATQEPPVAFEKQEKNAGGKGVMTMLQGIIDESKALEKDAQVAENDAQIAYEGFVADTHKQIEALQKQIVSDEAVVARDTKKDVEDAGDRATTVEDILKLGEVSTTLHNACDFTLANIGARQHARSDEMDALKESKMIFNGAAASLAQTGGY